MIRYKEREYFKSSLFAIAARIFYTAAVPVMFVWVCLFNGARISGLKNIKGLRSAVTVCNHVNKMDSALIASAFYPHKLVFPTVPEKIYKLFPGIFFNLLGCVSIPRKYSEVQDFFEKMKKLLAEGRIVHFFPEGFITPYSTEIQRFKRGAFFLAAQAHAPLVPMVISFHEPRLPQKILRKKPVMHLAIGEPISPASTDIKEDERIRMSAVSQQMAKMISPPQGI